MGGRAGETKELRISYSPLPSQREFHACAAPFKGFSGPIGSGKSMALCQEALRLAYVNPGCLGLLGAPTYPMLREATQATLFQVLDENRISYDHNKTDNALVLRDTRSKLIFRPVDEFERLRGTNLAWFGLDELTYCPEEAWLRLEGRLRDPRAKRLCGFAVWTPKGFDWVYRKFIEGDHTGYQVIKAQPRENRFVLENNPDYYNHLKGSYDEKFYKQEVEGEYLNMSGTIVYYAFNRAVHVKDLPVLKDRPLFWCLDFNVNPMSSVIAQLVDGTVHVVDEIVLRESTIQIAVEEFVARFGKHPHSIEIYGDASGHHQHTTSSSDYAVLQETFKAISNLTIRNHAGRSNPDVRERVHAVNRQLRNAAGDVRMYVHPKCKELILDFETVSYKADSTTVDKDSDRFRTHTSDALGYLVFHKFQPKPPAGPQNQGRVV